MDSPWERAAFEIVYQNFKKRDTVRIARNSAAPALGEIVPLTALVAGVRGDPPPPATACACCETGADTVEIVQAGVLQSHAAPYRLPSLDTALARWLAPEPLIQSHDPRICRAGPARHRARAGAGARRELLTHWVHRTLRRAIPPPGSVPSAVRVLETARGDCNDATTLFVALARSTGLPARTVGGLIYLNGRFYYHAWAEVYLNDWIAVDPTFDQFPPTRRIFQSRSAGWRARSSSFRSSAG